MVLWYTMADQIKTTVMFPENLLRALREYMVSREDASLHDQSNIVAAALFEYLSKRGVNIDIKNQKLKKFIVEEAKDESV